MIGLVPEMIYRVRTTNPLAPTQGSPAGVRQYWQVSEAELDGERIKAKLASTGSDWMARIQTDIGGRTFGHNSSRMTVLSC